MNRVLVIVVTYNAMKWAQRCFNSLLQSTITPDVFVVDNGSTDGSQTFIKDNFPEVIFHQSENNLGFGKANNIGMRYALENNYDFVYLLNQDAWLLPETLENMIIESVSHPDYGILSPIQTTAGLSELDKNFEYNFIKGTNVSETLTDVNYAMAAHWLIPKDTLLKVGLFSPSFPHYGEDVNYIHRLHWYGLKCGVVTNSKGIHDRENRVETTEKILYKNYMRAIVRISNPSKSIRLLDLIKEPLNLLVLSLKYRSFRSLLNIINLVGSYSTLIKNKKESQAKSAFVYIL